MNQKKQRYFLSETLAMTGLQAIYVTFGGNVLALDIQ